MIAMASLELSESRENTEHYNQKQRLSRMGGMTTTFWEPDRNIQLLRGCDAEA
jgi:hypothetical protein